MQVIQNVAAQLILLADPQCPTYQLHEQLHLDTLATRQCKSMVKITYNCIHDKMPIYLHEQWKPVKHICRVTCATEAGQLDVPWVRGKYGQYA